MTQQYILNIVTAKICGAQQTYFAEHGFVIGNKYQFTLSCYKLLELVNFIRFGRPYQPSLTR